jgi:hypothetical protein
MSSVKLPLIQKAQVTSIKLPLKQTALVINGFILAENIVTWKTKSITLIENIKSRLLLEAELVDKNHIKLKWFGEKVPNIQIFKRLDIEEYSNVPLIILPWDVKQYEDIIDSNSYDYKVIGVNSTGESNEVLVGEDKEYDINCTLEIPINEKNYFIDLDLISEYRLEVNF